MGELLLSIRIPVKLVNVNRGYGSNWFAPAQKRKQYERLLRRHGFTRLRPFRWPVSLVVTRILGSGERAWDYANIPYSSYKQLQDALVACGYFHDDSTDWIRDVQFRQDDSQRELGPAVQIDVHTAS